jgi:spore germination cell wall hydrolase CwlJ-like protein
MLITLCVSNVSVAEEVIVEDINLEYKGFTPPKRNIIEDARLSSVECMAMNAYRESRSESDMSNIMIMALILNRVADERFDNEICSVVLAKKQFSWVSHLIYDEIKNVEQYRRLYRLAEYVLMNQDLMRDLSQGATHYHTTKIKPYWVDSKMKYISTLDNHKFYKWI